MTKIVREQHVLPHRQGPESCEASVSARRQQCTRTLAFERAFCVHAGYDNGSTSEHSAEVLVRHQLLQSSRLQDRELVTIVEVAGSVKTMPPWQQTL